MSATKTPSTPRAVPNGLTPSEPALRLLELLRERGPRLSPLLIVTHDHPDPDALASAWVLSHLAQKIGRVRARIAYGGVVGRRENRLMLAILDIPASPLRASDRECAHAALVDTQPRFKNNRFDPSRKPDIIIDHHPRHRDTRADLLLIDETAGATTTVLAEALLASGLKYPSRMATAIVYGIGSETQNLGREAGPRDRAAYMAFLPKANLKVLWRIANPPRSASFFQTLARTITNAFVCRRIIGAHLKEIFSPDRVAQMADFLLTHENMTWSIVTGRYDGKLHISLRTTSPSGDAGRLLKRLLGGGSRGGGHRMIAGGSVRVGRGAPERKWLEAENRILADFLRSRGVADPAQRSYPFRYSL